MNISSFRGHIPLLLGLLSSPVFGASLSYDGFSPSDFPSELTLSGDAVLAGSAVRLTSAVDDQSGGLFTTNKVALGALNSFSTYFQFQITGSGGVDDLWGEDGPGADGLAFVIQTQSNQVGTSGGGLGYVNLNPSFVVEFDTFQNTLPANPTEPSGNHVGININGSQWSAVAASEPTLFTAGDIWNAWVDYDGDAQTVEVRWSTAETRPAAAQLTHTIDLATVFGPNVEGHFGFTSGTGSAWGNHDILKWTLEDEFNPITAVPEPGSAVALALLLTSSVLSHRRRGKK